MGYFVVAAIVVVPSAVMLWHLHRRGDTSVSFDGRSQGNLHPPVYREARYAERRKQWGPR